MMVNGIVEKQENLQVGKYICVECGEAIKKPKGSMIHPYCKECFKKLFDGDYNRYWRLVEETHIC